jgi:hypothetical protein
MLVTVSIKINPYRDLVVYRGWQRVAILYTGQRDGDGSGASAIHLQHLLLQYDIDCLTRRLPNDQVGQTHNPSAIHI